jgi:surfactin synthase thioesterase subunit
MHHHRLGALVCYELSREVRGRRLAPPNHLFGSVRRAPHLPARTPAMGQFPEGDRPG